MDNCGNRNKGGNNNDKNNLDMQEYRVTKSDGRKVHIMANASKVKEMVNKFSFFTSYAEYEAPKFEDEHCKVEFIYNHKGKLIYSPYYGIREYVEEILEADVESGDDITETEQEHELEYGGKEYTLRYDASGGFTDVAATLDDPPYSYGAIEIDYEVFIYDESTGNESSLFTGEYLYEI
jgi:hypothetical protein